MTVTLDKKYTTKGIGATKVMTSERQYEEYVSTLLDLERREGLTSAEENFAELLTLLRLTKTDTTQSPMPLRSMSCEN